MKIFEKYNMSDPETRTAINKERSRRLVVRLIFIIYWLLIFEGALRKWVFPGMHQFLFFIKDPFVLIVYWFAIKNKLFPKKNKLFYIGIALASFFILLILWHALSSDIPAIVLLYGWRMYFYYLPLAFIIGENFQGQDLFRLVRYTLLIAIPMAILSYLQYSTPPVSFWNSTPVGLAYTESGVAGGTIARITGTFTFFHGMQIYIGSIIAMVFSVWILPKNRRPLKGLLLFMAIIAVGVTFSIDITRLPTMLAIFIVTMCAFSIFVFTSTSMRIRTLSIILIGLIAVSMVAGIGLFSRAGGAREARFKGKKEYLKGRTTNMVTLNPRLFEYVPLFGFGLGYTSRGGYALARAFKIKYENPFALGGAGENEWQRIVSEAGSVGGVVYILYRMALGLWLLIGAIRAVHRSNNPLPLLLLAFILPVIFVWYMTTIGTVNGYGWMFAGFCLAANKLVDTWRTEDELV